jgi:hypothetical protein
MSTSPEELIRALGGRSRTYQRKTKEAPQRENGHAKPEKEIAQKNDYDERTKEQLRAPPEQFLPVEPPPMWEANHPANDEELPSGEAPTKKRRGGRTINILALVNHIRSTAAWDGVLRFNMLTQNYEIWPPFPPEMGANSDAARPLRDPYDILLTTMYFQANGFAKAGKGVVYDAMAAVAHEHSYHPIRDYLNGLSWDGQERVGALFWRYFNARLPDEVMEFSYLEHIATGFMVGAVARVMDPGCKHDHLPVIVGLDQGMKKSSAIRALCHDPAWFTDNIPSDLADRDTKESLAGKWIIEMAEIPHIRREVERLKAFLSSPVDRYRAAYGRNTQDHPRQSAFIGTSNDLEFVDVTGNRRFWPFISDGEIVVEAVVRDRDQLWAEAVDLYRRDVPWWLPPTIEAVARDQQAAFVETDIWDSIIARWLGARTEPFLIETLFAKDTGIMPWREAAQTTKAEEMRAGRCLTRLGWHSSRCTHRGQRGYWWKPHRLPAADPPPGPKSGEVGQS